MRYYQLILIILDVCLIYSFNLEPRIPVIKKGLNGSYFGYSVAEHQEISHDGIEKPKSWMLIGAPLDENKQPKTNKSGALWQCPMTTYKTDCIQVITDGRLNVESDDLIPPGNDEIKNNQWLGVTVRSQGIGGKVMVCAHRHIVRTADSQWGQGQCYILTQDLKYQDLKKPCSGKPTNKAHEQFGYCQAGTSGVLTSEDRVVIGTPGPHTWRGTLYLFTISDDFLNRDNTVYNAPMQDSSPVSKYSYLGMSVTVGNFFGTGLAYAAGAPRSNGTGQVILLTRRDNKPDMDVAFILDGEQFASSFGYEITSADVNGDKISDLIIAAPFYFNKAEGGAVYVYTTLQKVYKEYEKSKPIKLVGREESRFGFALTNLGDLNKDGYDDIAIGAPYEKKGTVYIYLGSKNGIITIPSQVIHAEDMPEPLQTFGYSLSGGIDMDQNGYSASYTIQNNYSSEPRIIKNPTTASLKRGTGGRSSFNGIVCTVFGCSGFIGSSLCIRLGKIGTQLILPHRCDHYHIRELKVGGDLGQVFYHPFDLRDEESIIRTIKYSNVVINLIGSNYETRNFSFEDVHVEGARTLAKLAKQCNVERFIHMSCLNVEEKPTPIILKESSKILKTKWKGELAVKEEFPEATIIRPSVIYGHKDKFISHYMDQNRLNSNRLPLWDKGEKTEKQPVSIHDVISGIVAIIRNSDTAGKTYQFVGPKRYKLNELVKWMFDIKFKYFENNIKIVDMKYDPYAWLKTSLREYIYAIHPTTDMLWEVLECHHINDKIDSALPTLDDLGITPIDLQTRIEWEITPYIEYKMEIENLQRIIPPNVKSIPK